MNSAYEDDLEQLLEILQKAERERLKHKLSIINTLTSVIRLIPKTISVGSSGHVEDIYKTVKNSGDQFNTIVTQIAKDMNETSVSEVLNNLEKYKTVNETPSKTTGTPEAVIQSSPDTVPVQTREEVNQPVPRDLLAKLQAKLKNPSWRQDNSDRDKNGRIIYTFEDGGKVYSISNDENNTPIILSVTPISEQ
jgi:hypothetical protein